MMTSITWWQWLLIAYAAIGLLGQLLCLTVRDWQEEDAWFCSELVAWAFQHAGEPLFRAECLRRVTPQHLWMLAPAPPPPDPAFLNPIEGRLVRPSSF